MPLGVRYVSHATRTDVRLGAPAAWEGAPPARATSWRARSAPESIVDPPSHGRWFLRADECGVSVDRRVCGVGAKMRLAVVDDDVSDPDLLDLDSLVYVGVDRAAGIGIHSSLLIGWAVGTMRTRDDASVPFRGVAPGASPRVYCVPLAGTDVLSTPLAIARAVDDGADVVLLTMSLESSSSPMLDDAFEFATRLGRRGRGTALVVATGRQASSGPGSVHASWSLSLADPASDPRVFCIGPSGRGGGWFLWRDKHGSFRPFANRGPAVRWMAPGDDVAFPLQARERMSHAESSGAAAIAAGVALLVLGSNPTLRSRDLDAALTRASEAVTGDPSVGRAPLADVEDLLPHGRDRDGHNAKHGYGLLHATRTCATVRDPFAAALATIGEDSAAARWLRAGPRHVYSRALARWAARVVLEDSRVDHAFRVVARHARLVALEPSRHDAHGAGALARQLAVIVRMLSSTAHRSRAPRAIRAELERLDARLRAPECTSIDAQLRGIVGKIWRGDLDSAAHDRGSRRLARPVRRRSVYGGMARCAVAPPMSPRFTPPRWYVYLTPLVGAVIALVAGQRAIDWYGHPFPGVFVDPDMVVSSVGLPTWDGIEKGLRFPDRVVEIDGVDLRGPQRAKHDAAWDQAIESAVRDGRPSVHVRVETNAGARELDLRIERLSPVAWWVLSGNHSLMAGLYLLTALTALMASPDGALARTFAKAAFFSALFMWTVLDFHTSRALVPVNELAMCMMSVAFVELALRLPDDVPVFARRPWLGRALDALGVGFAIALHCVAPYNILGRSGASILFAGGLFLFVAIVIVRFIRARGQRRVTLRGLVGGLLIGPFIAAVAVGLAFATAEGTGFALILMPALALSPISAAVAYVRHDLWNGDAPISRAALRVVTTGAICLVAVAAGAGLSTYLGVPLRSALAGAAAGGVLATALATVALDLLDRGVFASRAEYKPTIEQLSEELTSMTTRDEVATAIERTVRRWLACDKVEFRSAGRVEPEGSPLESGERAIVAGKALSLDVRFRAATLGVLRVSGKRGGAPFTTDDVDLLQTIANQAALALAHAQAYEELDQRRRQQVAAWREERAAIVETVAAEITHEVRYPINFFRSVFQPGHKLDDEEIEIGCEEVSRLERLVSGLRRVTGQRLERHFVPLVALTTRAELLLRDTLGGRRLDISVPEGISIRCDTDHVTQVLVNLLANALEASQAAHAVGVRWAATSTGGELIVWDRGPGFDADIAQLFAPWFTTKPRGTGLGLAITHRLVRAHGWAIDGARRDGTTLFVVSIPAADVSVVGRARGTEVA